MSVQIAYLYTFSITEQEKNEEISVFSCHIALLDKLLKFGLFGLSAEIWPFCHFGGQTRAILTENEKMAIS